MIVKLTENRGYKWCMNGNVWFKGYFQYDNNTTVYRDEKAAREFGDIESLSSFIEKLQGLDGIFSVIIEKGKKVFAATDRARSIPIFYGGGFLSDSAETIRSSMSIDKSKVDDTAYLEFMSNDYLFGHKTMYAEIAQLDLAEAVEFIDGNANVQKYYFHCSKIDSSSKSELMKKLTEVSYNVFHKIKVAIGDRQAVLSMSGGYDSRYVACMLKNVGVTNVFCYTYGKKESFEVKQSKTNADALGFKWFFVEYTDEIVNGCLDSMGLDYINSYSGHDYTMYLQNFPAVRYLVEHHLIEDDAVFLTGLCGDMPTGNYIDAYNEKKRYDEIAVAERLYEMIFTRYEMKDDFKRKWIDERISEIRQLPFIVNDYQSYVSAVDSIYTGTCHVHCFLHMNAVHSFFGYEWLLPYWDKSLLDLWYSIPAAMRIKQAIYEDWLLGEICLPYGIGSKKTRKTYGNNPVLLKIKYQIGSMFAFVLYHLGIVFRRDIDYSNFAPLELLFFQKLKTRKYIKYKKAGLMLLQTQYILQTNYGIGNLKRLYKRVK